MNTDDHTPDHAARLSGAFRNPETELTWAGPSLVCGSRFRSATAKRGSTKGSSALFFQRSSRPASHDKAVSLDMSKPGNWAVRPLAISHRTNSLARL
jgi:hypothetical protein